MSRRRIVLLLSAALVLLALVLAFQFALRRLHAAVLAALGPQATLQSVSLGWTGVELRGLRLRAPPGGRARWPAQDELVAERIRVVPSIASLWRRGWQLSSVTVEGAELSMLRSRDGRLRVLPSWLPEDRAAARARAPREAPAAKASTTVQIGALRLRDVAIDFHDATVSSRGGLPHRLRLQALRADIGPLALPALDRPASIELQATLAGPQRKGSLAMHGELTPATLDAELSIEVRGLDLVALQPYLLRSNEATVRRGTLDLSIDATVKDQRLKAPGRLTIDGLELASGGGLFSTFAGVPQQAVLAAMSRDGRIELAITLEGRVDDPKFSLNELFAARLAAGLADKLGVGLGGVAQGIGGFVKGLFGQ